MLRSLSVRNYVLIDSLEISFPEGLIIITGQTGAGKSILLGALSLLMGSKADASSISEGEDSCVVEAEFDISANQAVVSLLEENGFEAGDGTLIIRRVVNRTGRSRSFVNDEPASVQLLSQLSSHLIDIHSQHQSLLLTDARFQMSVLDAFAGNGSLLENCKNDWLRLQFLNSEIEKVKASIEKLSSEKDFNESRYRQLEAAALKENELEELEVEQRQLSNAEEIKSSLCQVENLFNPEESSSDRLSVDFILKESEHILSKLSRFIPQALPISERIASSRIELDDILSEISDRNSKIEISSERLNAVEDRMSLLYDLMKKYSCNSIGELIQAREYYSKALFDSSELELRLDELNKELGSVRSSFDKSCSDLHESRVKAAVRFSASITDSIHFLELDRAVFKVDLKPASPSASGTDSIQFLFSSSGINPVDVSKCASGGEISRIMLSLKAMMARFTSMPTLIFDEIDTGVSGSVADRMGSMICSMGADMQVFAITHLPQVAAKGKAHYLVSKSYDNATGAAVSTITYLEDEERVMELARMLSGATISDAAVQNARSLLENC